MLCFPLLLLFNTEYWKSSPNYKTIRNKLKNTRIGKEKTKHVISDMLNDTENQKGEFSKIPRYKNNTRKLTTFLDTRTKQTENVL